MTDNVLREGSVNKMTFTVLAGVLSAVMVFVLWVVVFAEKPNPCKDCEVYVNEDSDYRHCFDCKRGREG